MNLHNLTKPDLLNYIKANKESILQDRLRSVATAPIETAFIPNTTEVSTVEADKTTLDVKMVCSTSWFFNSNLEVLTDTAYDASLAARGNNIPHILDHKHSAVSHVGDTQKVYTQKMLASSLGVPSEQEVTALIMESTVRQDYNADVFKFYANGKINQHSIGYTYNEVKLAVNSIDKEFKAEKELWDTYYPKVVNKATLDKIGVFFLVSSLDILENSAVLLGANSLTPTLSVASLSLATRNSPLGNKEETVTTQPIGNTMTLDEALGEIISLKTELATAKAEVGIAKASARLEEKTRTLGILKAQATFGSEDALKEAAHEFIEKDYDLKAATSMLESLKGHIQKASHVDTTEATLKATQIKPTPIGEASFEDTLLAGLKSLGEQPTLFKGVR